ncbi:amino acid permease C-terminal domain-containing protein [Bacillus cereus]|uniref:amino acid permease C-terminal domain-containing protein n=1 Tax=Bacillus cereus TaxID=1396 RepID=UPI0021B5FAF2|nr:amino acid permease C-terminal domain-containing protein [Bacillus cereus]
MCIFFLSFFVLPYIRKQSVFIQVVFFTLQRPATTWIVFAIWFVIGLVVYFSYKNGTLQKGQKEDVV